VLTARLNERTWLDGIAAYGDISYSENHLHGCESAAWGMPARTRHRDLRPGALVQIYDLAQIVWTGYLDEPGRDGSMTAAGWWKLGQGVHAANADGVTATSNPWFATRYALQVARGGDPTNGRGAVPWYGPASDTYSPVFNQSFGDTLQGDLTLTALLDRYTEATGSPWRVDHLGYLRAQPSPTTPRWGLSGSEAVWTWSREEYVTHVNVTYMSGAGVFSRFQRTSPESLAAAARFGPQEVPLDLTAHGIITLAAAQAAADALLARVGSRMTLAEGVTVQPGQLETFGGNLAGWAGVHAGQMMRLWGVLDQSRNAIVGHTDFVIDRLDRGPSTLTLSPPNLPPRSVADVIAELTQLAA
jgi:hypothetical protein